MENKLRVFENEQFGEVRTVFVKDTPWFVAADICKALEITNPSKAVSRLDEDEKMNTLTSSEGNKRGNPNMTVVNEAGLYSLIISSRKPEAKTFKRWITHEVIPAIRKTGGYVNNDDLFVETYFADANEEQKEMFRSTLKRIRTLNQKIEEDKPKVLLANAVSGSDNAISVADMAKILKQNGVDIGQKRFYEWLREKGFLVKQAGISWNTPTQRGMNSGFFEIKEYAFVNGDKTFITKTTRVTGKGQQHFVKMFLGDRV